MRTLLPEYSCTSSNPAWPVEPVPWVVTRMATRCQALPETGWFPLSFGWTKWPSGTITRSHRCLLVFKR